ncbi:MAG: hypothetical protein ACK4TA_01045 [Saprospiraceae bacterium]
MKKVLSFALILLLLGCASDAKKNTANNAVAGQKDFMIVPGERVGLITSATTEAVLQELYGTQDIDIQSISIAEGDTQEGVVLYPGTRNELEIIWESAASEGTPAFVRIGKDSTEWHTPEGITIGTTLEKLEDLNGKPFTFYGFEWDYGGLITDWNDGKLSEYLIIALVPQNFAKLTDDLLGEVQLSSDDPRVRALQAKVGSIVVTFRPPFELQEN